MDREYIQLIARIAALKLEIKGLRRSGQSAYAICKEVYGMAGNRSAVLKQLEQLKVRLQNMQGGSNVVN